MKEQQDAFSSLLGELPSDLSEVFSELQKLRDELNVKMEDLALVRWMRNRLRDHLGNFRKSMGLRIIENENYLFSWANDFFEENRDHYTKIIQRTKADTTEHLRMMAWKRERENSNSLSIPAWILADDLPTKQKPTQNFV